MKNLEAKEDTNIIINIINAVSSFKLFPCTPWKIKSDQKKYPGKTKEIFTLPHVLMNKHQPGS